MELQQKRQMVRNFDARIHRKTTLQIQTSNTKTATTCTVSMRTQDIWEIGARTNRNRHFATSRTRRNYPRPKSSRKYLILCRIGIHHPPSRTEYICKRTGTCNRENNKNLNHMLDNLATNPNANVRFYPSNMILNVRSDVSYLSAKDVSIRAAGHFFLGWEPDNKQPIRLNGPILTLCKILNFVAASAAEAELGAMFLSAKEAKIIRLTLEELSHPQPPTPMHCNNTTAAGIANNTVK